MRINKFVAQATGLSRREVDKLIDGTQVIVNGSLAQTGQQVTEKDVITLSGKVLKLQTTTTIMLNKPVGYVCSRNGQGSKTIYNLLPKEYHNLKPVGRLDKDSSGLLILTNDGDLAHQLTHPSFNKIKIYKVSLDKPLASEDKTRIERGVQLNDGMSKLILNGKNKEWTVTMHEGRNRQIRRTFKALNYRVDRLHRTHFSLYHLGTLPYGKLTEISQ